MCRTSVRIAAVALFLARSAVVFGATSYGGTTELGELNGQGGWVLSEKKGGEAPSSPQVISPGLGGSRAALFHMIGYDDPSNDSTQHGFPATSGTKVTVEITVRPSSASRCISIAVRSGTSGAAYVRFNGRKSGWCQHYDDSDTYRDIAPYTVDGENRLKIELNTFTRKLKAWVNGVGGDEWNFHRSVSSVNRLDIFMTHGNGPEVWSIIDDIVVRDDGGNVVYSEDFETYYTGANTAPAVSAGPNVAVQPGQTASLNGSASDDGLPNPPGQLTVTWSKVSGSGTVSFANPGAAATTATFSQEGAYALRLTASDGSLSASDDVIVTVSSSLPSGIQISPSGHYFTYNGKTTMLLCDSGTQCVMQNLNVDYRAWVDAVAAEGHPGAHVWAFVPPRQKLDGSKVENRWGYVYPGAAPWGRKTSGADAYDGGKQWDLFSFDEGADPDEHYWPRLRDICWRLKDKGMMLGITVFFGWPKDVPGDLNYHPFYYLNGGPATSRGDITHIDSPGTEVHTETWSDSWPARKKTQWLWEKFCLKLIDETSAHGNVWFDFRDEWSYDNDTNMETHFRNFFMSRGQIWADRSADASFRVTNPGVPSFGSTPAMKTEGGPYGHDGVRVEVWGRAMSGVHYLLHNDSRDPGIMAWDPNSGKNPDSDLGRKYVGHAARFFNQYVNNLDSMSPNDGLVGGSAKCLANPGGEYAVYVPQGQSSVTVDLSALSGTAVARFYDPRAGTIDLPFSVDGGGARTMSTPGSSQDWGLLIQAGGSGNSPPDVDAGADTSITLPDDTVNLDGTVADDGLPGGALTTTWAKVSGPGTVTFADATAVDTTAGFSQAGTYILRLTASDGELAASDEVTVTVKGADIDGDGLPDSWEEEHFGSTSACDPGDDPDADGLSNLEEHAAGSDPNDPDTDGDGTPDGDDLDPTHAPLNFGGFELGAECGGGGSLLAALFLLAVVRRRGRNRPDQFRRHGGRLERDRLSRR